jgi:hypothetical protein
LETAPAVYTPVVAAGAQRGEYGSVGDSTSWRMDPTAAAAAAAASRRGERDDDAARSPSPLGIRSYTGVKKAVESWHASLRTPSPTRSGVPLSAALAPQPSAALGSPSASAAAGMQGRRRFDDDDGNDVRAVDANGSSSRWAAVSAAVNTSRGRLVVCGPHACSVVAVVLCRRCPHRPLSRRIVRRWVRA